MLYRVFKWLFYLTVKGYFRSIYIKGKENIPASGPVIFVANHNSAFMDPILLAVHINRPIYFLARGESFTSKLVSTIFGWLHMIPIYKPEITPDEVYKNKAIFQKCFDHLGRGKTIMIFPEGISETVRKLRPIKTGTARIALGAEEQHQFGLGVQIVPIGINYSNPHYFRSDVFVEVGSSIGLDQYREGYNADPVGAVLELTNLIKDRLEQLIVMVEDQSIDQLVKDIERLYRSTLREEMPEEHKASQDFYLSQEIVKAVVFNRQNRPKKSFKFERRIRQYFRALDKLKISDSKFRDPGSNNPSPWRIPYFIFGLPIFVYGFLVNILPYMTVGLLSRRVSVRADFIGSMKLAFGMFVFLIFYVLQVLIFATLTNWAWGIVFALSLYPGGLFAVNYLNQWYRFKAYLNYLRLKAKRKEPIGRLQRLRDELLNELDVGRHSYLESLD
ncbi:lysophospholipid acyltransferase family protein [Lentiprolixibacter aurantiacus]|uniref:Lysophospholipid acyltransferase family protein n=1 Tax=Lentiprolixibacter aurantiacus TaxID=2993939 RepID=A0AAE3MNK1_9FLAO|nr:lysophospholipid acyltransferase family protein [Lentiprolixibacter aurantiacus]MCX2720488.1 lysophospholipid acyltransferase family protein [Lentiprolixibacter aurantiacus]